MGTTSKNVNLHILTLYTEIRKLYIVLVTVLVGTAQLFVYQTITKPLKDISLLKVV